MSQRFSLFFAAVIAMCSVVFEPYISARCNVAAQELSDVRSFRSVHEVESARESVLFQLQSGAEIQEVGRISPGVEPLALAAKPLRAQVLGWYPYWMNSAYTSLDYSVLSTIAYFSYEVDTATGAYKTVRQWKTTDLIAFAHERGTKVLLTVTNFGNANNAAVLRSPAKRRTLIDSVWALVNERNADGVNIDFEGITDASLRDSMTVFMRDLAAHFHSGFKPLEVSIALPAVDWSGVFNVRSISADADYCIVMGYDYHWSSAPDAGPVAPLDSSKQWGKYSALRSLRTYLAAGVPRAKLMLGVPYYGYEWPVSSMSVPAQTTGNGTSMQYATAVERALTHGRRWDAASATPYYMHTTEQRQGWYDDSTSLAVKYDSVLSYGLGGIGIWALGYDGNRTELWSVLRNKFLSTTVIHTSDVCVASVRAAIDNGDIVVCCTSEFPVRIRVDIVDALGRSAVAQEYGTQQGVWSVRIAGATLRGAYFARVQTGSQTTIVPLVL